MQPSFRYILSLLFFLPFLAMAAPSPAPSAAPQELPDLSGLMDKLGGIGDLLDPKTFEYLATLLRNGAKLLSDENTKILVDTVKLLGGLLTKEMVDQIKGLIADIAPVCRLLSVLADFEFVLTCV